MRTNEYWVHGIRAYTKKQFMSLLSESEKEEVFMHLLSYPDAIQDYDAGEDWDWYDDYHDWDFAYRGDLYKWDDEEQYYDPAVRK